MLKSHRWHQDIKPQNILIVKKDGLSPYEWTFKLADLGLSHFKAISNGNGGATDLDTFGTRTYGLLSAFVPDSVHHR